MYSICPRSFQPNLLWGYVYLILETLKLAAVGESKTALLMVITGDYQIKTPGPVVDPGEALSSETSHSLGRAESLSGNL